MFAKLREFSVLAIQVFFIVFVLKSFAFASNHIPSESMVPTLEVGDRVFVAKWPYGYSRYSLLIDPAVSAPGPAGRVFDRLPERGDVVTFTHPKRSDTMIKRVIGLPGETIELRAGRLVIDGVTVERIERDRYAYREYRGGIAAVVRYDEVLPGGHVHSIIERTDSGPADTFGPVTVPPGHLFMMGDNRDNSGDSRFSEMGFVPLENLQGRADVIGWSLYACESKDGLHCARRRFLSAIE